jgi:hypothetical protein
MRKTLLAVGLVGVLTGADYLAADEFNLPKGPCGSKPLAQPQRRKGGEGVPPLPLPATPLRRTERKRPPSPPSLIAKIQFGVPKEIKDGDQAIKYYDWDKDKADISGLLTVANPALNMNYTFKSGPLESFPPDPAQYPIFYYTGSDDFTLTDAEVGRLREFIRAGGTVWGNACYGDPDFFKAFLREMGKVMPDRSFHKLPPDHPLLNCYYQIKQVVYTRPVPDAPNGEPILFGMDIGCRTAMVLTRYGLSCGWDGHIRDGAFNVHPNDARKVGVNMIAYALAENPIAQYQSTAKVYYEEDARPRGEFVLVQARVGENWDSQFNEIANLLKNLATRTTTEIKFERKVVDLGKGDLQSYPFLYITGHYDFKLTDDERKAVANYLRAGGFILASPCCGSREFDVAFRREIAGVLPANPLLPLAQNHPVYSILNTVKSVSYTPYVESLGEPCPKLPLEGVTLGSTAAVIYSPYGLGGGWRGFDHPFGRDIASDDATKLGMNAVLYSMTH